MGMSKNSKTARQFDAENMQHIVRLYNTNIDGTKKIAYSLTRIKGIGKRFGRAVVLKAGIDANKFAGKLNAEEIQKVTNVIDNPLEHGIPEYFLNHQRDIVTNESTQLVGIKLDGDLRYLIEQAKKVQRGAWVQTSNGTE